MRAVFPDRSFRQVPGNPGVIVVDEFELGLENLRREYDHSDKSEQTLKELVKDHLTVVSRGADAPRFPDSFEAARGRILPQFMPPALAADSQNVRIPFAGNLFIGLVADDDRAYMYVGKDALKKWRKSEEDLYAIALQNLDSRSQG